MRVGYNSKMIRVWFFNEHGKIRNRISNPASPESIDDSAAGIPGQCYSKKTIARAKRNEWLPIAVPETEKQLAALEKVRRVGKRKLSRLRRLLGRIKKQERGEYANTGERTVSSGRVR